MRERGDRPRTKASVALAAVIALAAITVSVSSAASDEATRGSYREAVEPICQANAKANERILAGVRKLVRHGKLRRAAARFQQAASALRRTLGELKSVPRPAADEARLAKWLGDVAAEAMLFEAVARKLRAGERAGAQAIVVRLTHNATIANGVVVMFEFHYCRLEPSRFT